MEVLLIEDDPSVCKVIDTILSKRGDELTIKEDAETGEVEARKEKYDIIILDLGLPDGNGMDICKELREEEVETPILILSAEQETEAKIMGLDYGADDYLTKPFDPNELLARMNAITRRAEKVEQGFEEYECGELKINLLDREFFVGEEKVFLTNNEFNLITYFMKNPDRIIPQEELAAEVWDIHFDTQTNYINVYISYLRKKVAEHTDTKYIKTIRKKGFKLLCENHSSE